MKYYMFEFRCGNNLTSKRFENKMLAFAYGTKIDADFMREVDIVWPNQWEKPKELLRMYNEYKTEQR
jgi:hypothetical protein